MAAHADGGQVEVARHADRVLARSSAAALVLEVPSERVIAASPAALRLLSGDAGQVVGHDLEEFTADDPSGGLELFARGRLNGFETARTLRQPDGSELAVTAWLRAFDHEPRSRYALLVLVPDYRGKAAPPSPADAQDVAAVMGTADESLAIERLSGEAEDLFGVPAEEMLGRSLIGLAAPDDVPHWLGAVSQAADSRRGVTLALDIRLPSRAENEDAPTARCEALILPLQPPPSCVFALLPIRPDAAGVSNDSFDLHSVLSRLLRATELAELARGAASELSERAAPGISRLTTRELDVAARLLSGDRVSAIADALSLTQSTVRNHLAAVYAKLGVNSQQELLALFRASRDR